LCVGSKAETSSLRHIFSYNYIAKYGYISFPIVCETEETKYQIKTKPFRWALFNF
jgi:hypothetical protein